MGTRGQVLSIIVLLAAALPLQAQTADGLRTMKLPAGVKVRVQLRASADGVGQAAGAAASTRGGARFEAFLKSSEGGVLTIIPEVDSLASGELEVSIDDVERLELGLGKKRHAVRGLLVGAALGALFGLVDEVDPVMCRQSDYIECTRASAVGWDAAAGALVGLSIGAAVRTQVWVPVATDVLDSRPVAAARPPVGLQFTVRF